MFKLLRIVLFIGALLVIVVSVNRLLNATTPANAASTNGPLDTATIDRGDIPIVVNATGTIQAQQNVSLAFATSGKVTSINVKVGDFVRKGQTIATIDNRTALASIAAAQEKVTADQIVLNNLQAKPRQVDIDVAQANVNVAQANLTESQHSGPSATSVQSAQLNVEVAKNQLWQAELSRDANAQQKAQLQSNGKSAAAANLPTDAQVNRPITSAGYNVQIAQDQLDATKSTGTSAGGIMSAQANLDSAQAQLKALLSPANPDDVKQAQDNLASAQTALDAAKLTLTNTQLTAPFDGMVAQIKLNVGEAAPSSQAVILVDTSSFYVDVPVAELDVANINVGQDVNLLFQALPNVTVPGKVILISDTANASTPITYNVRIQINSAGKPLLSTMSTTAAIIISNAPNVIRIPNRFIRIDRTTRRTFATVQQPDGTFQEVQIQIGTANDTYTEVKSGLQVGQVVTVPSTTPTTNRGAGGNPIGRLLGGG